MSKIYLKLIFLLFVIFINNKAKTQNSDNIDTYAETLKFYEKFDKSRAKTDMFFNTGFIALNELESVLKKHPLMPSVNKWKTYYNSLNNSKNKNVLRLPNDRIFNEFIKPADLTGTDAMLAVLLYSGDYFTLSELEKTGYDSYSPKLTQLTFFSGVSLKPKMYNTSVNFKYKPEFLFTNIEDIKTFQINFEDGNGYREVRIEKTQTIPVTYDCTGEKSICFRFITNNNDTLISFSKINILMSEPIKFDFTGTVFSDSLYKGSKAAIDYAVLMGCDGYFDKPVIISEGFDFLGTHTMYQLQDEWSETIARLRSHGYEVVIVKIVYSSHTLTENASAMKGLIKIINGLKQTSGHSNHETIYIGESMSGLVGRIALRQLENERYDHQVGLYVSFDSPHKGAYVPLGIQWLVEDLKNLFPGFVSNSIIVDIIEEIIGEDLPIADLYTTLNSKGAMQMLLRHYKPMGISIFNQSQNYLNNLGFPKKCRNIVFTNGSNIGTNQGTIDKKLLDIRLMAVTAPPYAIYPQIKAWFPSLGNSGSETIYRSGLYHECWFGDLCSFNIGHSKTAPLKQITYYNAPGGMHGKDVDVIIPTVGEIYSQNFNFVPSVSAIDFQLDIHQHENFLYLFNESSISWSLNTQELVESGLSPFNDIYSNKYNFMHTDYDDFNNADLGYSFTRTLEKQEIMYNDMFLQNRILDKVRDFEAYNKIVAGSDVTDLSGDGHTKLIDKGDFVIKSGNTVNFRAKNQISLRKGFKVEQGARFSARLAEFCDNKNSSKIIKPPKIAEIERNKVFAVKNFEKSTPEWRLTGIKTDTAVYCDKFIVPENLAYGQYTLHCGLYTKQGYSEHTKVIKVRTDLLKKQKQDNQNTTSSENLITVNPNPASNEIVINLFGKEEISSVVIINSTGKNFYTKNNLQTNIVTINISNFPQGLYFIKIFTDKNTSYVKKFIKD